MKILFGKPPTKNAIQMKQDKNVLYLNVSLYTR